jgi:hypothetical protein
MTDAELVERLRRMSPRLDMMDCEDALTAADRIEALVKEKKALGHMFNAAYNRHVAEIIDVETKLADALAKLRECEEELSMEHET